MQNPKQPYRYYSSYSSARPIPLKQRQQSTHRRRYLLPVLALTSLVFVATLVVRGFHHEATAEVKAAVSPPAVTLPTVDEASLNSQINQLVAAHPELDMAVSIRDLTTNKQYDYGLTDASFVAASTAKLVTASLYLHQVEQGTASLTDTMGGQTAQEALRLMIEDSDNSAWAALNGFLTHEALLGYAKNLGLNSYNPDTNLISPADLSVFLGQLYQHKLLNNDHTNLLLSYMKQANETQYIAAAIPNGIKLYHKAGYLADRAHDAAIVDNGKRPFTLIIFTKAKNGTVYDQQVGANLMHQITGIALKVLTSSP
jgi:beta-lactamase class A